MTFEPIKPNAFGINAKNFQLINEKSKNKNTQESKPVSENKNLMSPDAVLTHMDATSMAARPQVKKIDLSKYNDIESVKRIEEAVNIFEKMFQNSVNALKSENLNLSDDAINKIALKMVS